MRIKRSFAFAAVLLIMAFCCAPVSASVYEDVPDSHWAAGWIGELTDGGVLGGTAPGQFSPDAPLTRADLLTILGRSVGLADSAPSSPAAAVFADVDTGAYFASHVAWAAAAEIVGGVGDDRFAPRSPVTRQDLAVILVGLAADQGYSLSPLEAAAAFDDGATIAGYARSAVSTLQRAGLIDGSREGGQLRFRPQAAASRAEVAKLICLLRSQPGFAAALASPIHGPEQVLTGFGSAGDRLTVSWCDSAADSVLQYSEAPTLTGAKEIAGTVTLAGEGYCYFNAELTGLTPGGQYYYRVGGADGWSETHTCTAPADGGDGFSFLYLGDLQFSSLSGMVRETADWRAMVRRAQQQSDAAFVLQGGDLVENGRNAEQWRCVLNGASRALDGVPLLPVAGNHESNSLSGKPETMTAMLNLPANGPAGFTEEFYSFDYQNCHFTMLNSNVFLGEQLLDETDFAALADWIAADLAAADATWKIVVLHHPPFGLENVSEQVLAQWTPLFEAGGADLVFCGHQHVYLRTTMWQGLPAPEGVVYVMGVSGQKFAATAAALQPSPPDWPTVLLERVSNYQQVTVRGSQLTLTTYSRDGRVLDRCTYGGAAE